MRFLVTGAGGFLGRHLVDALTRRGDAVQAWVRQPVAVTGEGNSSVEPVVIDVTNGAAIARQLDAFAPDTVVHLAAQSLPGRSWDDPVSTYRINVIGALHLLEGARALKKPPRMLLAGSSAEYGEPAHGGPIDENAPTEPNSPYASSKLAADQLAQLYYRRYALDIIRFRPFFLIGPSKTGDVSSDFARRIVAIERGDEKVLRVGALDIVRDMIDVRDGVDAILRVAEAGKSGELYNICGGKGVSIRNLLDIYRKLASVKFEIEQDPQLTRPLEQREKIGNSSKLRALGWRPRHVLNDTLRSILEYWRQLPRQGTSAS